MNIAEYFESVKDHILADSFVIDFITSHTESDQSERTL